MTRTDDTEVPDYPSRLRLDGKGYIVLGAGQGIGRQASHALASVGANVVTVDLDPDLAADIGAVGPMVSKLIEGMAVALYTTLTGAVLNIWLMVNYRLLEGGVVHLLTQIVERGEASHGRA